MIATVPEHPGAATAAEQVESLLASLPAVEAFAALEHRFGVLPLAAGFFTGLEIVNGALGLFTPTPELTWDAAAVDGERSGAGLLLRGEVRVANPRAAGAIVLARLDGAERRLAWVGQAAVNGRLVLDGAAVPPEQVSTPVTLALGSDFVKHLEAYTGVWALAAAIRAREEVHALRRAARITRHREKAFSASQLVALGITEVEIEADLTLAAARGAAGGLRAAAAAARCLHAVAALAVELRDQAGLEIAGQPHETARALTAFLGGPLLIESELGRSLGIPETA